MAESLRYHSRMTDVVSKAGKDDFHRERSRFIDAFAALEEALLHPSGLIADQQLADQVRSLRQIRNDLVHSQLRFIQLEGQLQAVAVNAQDSIKPARQARLLRIEDLKLLSSQIVQAEKAVRAAR